ncbi:MAG TPA: RNA polymerase sigma factor [Acidobacteriaceae bacterium]|nr:RNA polymerase sigma factor [Acidobacteriaceae bacterium]
MGLSAWPCSRKCITRFDLLDGSGNMGHATHSAPKGIPAVKQRMPTDPDSVEQTNALVRRCLQGDNHAWRQIVESQHRRVYSLCYRFTGSTGNAEDLTQDVFLKVYRNLKTFDVERGSFHTWLTTLTRNLLVDHFRRTRAEQTTDSLDAGWDDPEGLSSPAERIQGPESDPLQHCIDRELQTLVQRALLRVSPELREAVILRDLKDMDYKEIAEVLRIPEGTVKSRINRGRMELARLLERTKKQVM